MTVACPGISVSISAPFVAETTTSSWMRGGAGVGVGVGEGVWPLARRANPKQRLTNASGKGARAAGREECDIEVLLSRLNRGIGTRRERYSRSGVGQDRGRTTAAIGTAGDGSAMGFGESETGVDSEAVRVGVLAGTSSAEAGGTSRVET